MSKAPKPAVAPHTEPLLKVEDLMLRLQISKSKAYELLSTWRDVVHVGSSVRITEASFQAFLRTCGAP